MKVSLLQIFIASSFLTLSFAAEVEGQKILEKKLSISFQNTTLRAALNQIEEEAGVKFLFYSQIISEEEVVSFQARNEKLRNILNEILRVRKIKYEADGNHIVLTLEKSDSVNTYNDNENKGSLLQAVISGVITDETNAPLPGVTVAVKGTTNGTASDGQGKYTIEAEPTSTLVFSFIGYLTQEVNVNNQSEVNISLVPDVSTLDEVLVVGYGTQKKSDVISSISTISEKDLNMQYSPNFESSLQGLAAGVNVQSQSGTPGAPVKILIRGTSSINLTTDPLYIIDGMPITMGTSGLGSSNQSPMSLINQNDIESIQILKDAAATSIYGSRGSNGVIIVTTKSGKKGEGSVQLNYSTGFSTLTRTPEDVGFANTQEWFQIMDEAYENSNIVFNDDLREYYNRVPNANISNASPKLTRQQAEAINTSWYDELFRVGSFQNINVAASQGTENTSFYISGNYRKDKGVQNNNALERFTIRTNLDFTPTQNLTISSKLTFGYTKNDQRESAITSIGVNALPWLPVRELDNPNRYYNAYAESNPVAFRDPENLLDQVKQYRGLGGVSINYRLPFVKGLSLRTELSGDLMQSNRVNWRSADIRINLDKEPESFAYEEAITSTGLNYNGYATYDRTFNKHSFTAVAGVEATRSSQYFRSITGTGLVGKYQQVGSPTSSSGKGEQNNERYLLGYFGRLNYKFNERYILGLSARRDGSTVFTEENRWATFMAISAGWIISEEKFMSFLGSNTFIKIRGSYGEVGNQNLPSGLDVINYNDNTSNIINGISYGGLDILGVNGTIPVNIAVNNLRWESTKSSDIGIDFGVLSNRLNGSVAYYHRLVDGMLLQAALPYSAGVSSPTDVLLGQGSYDFQSSIWGNFANMVNSGFEMELHSVNLDKNGWRWTTDFNIGFNKNVIKKLTDDIDEAGGGLQNAYQNTISRTGDRRAVWYIADYAGVDRVSGTPLVYALDVDAFEESGVTRRLKDADGNDVVLPATITNIRANRFYQDGKSGDPKYQGGITNTVSYKGFDFSFVVAFSGGNYILDYDRQQATIVNPTRTILKEVYTKSWQETGDVADYPQLTARFTHRYNNQNITGFEGTDSYHNGFLYKGDFIRLRNVQLGYSLPSSVLQRLKLKSTRVYVAGSNLFTKTKYPGFDPESAGAAFTPGFVYYANAIPQLKTFTVGVDLKF